MGRSVSTPSSAYLIAYSDWYHGDYEDEETGETKWHAPDGLDWDNYIDDIMYHAQDMWPSLSSCREKRIWLGREDCALLENGLVYFGASEYCGLAAIWIAPKDGDVEDLARGWCDRVSKKFHESFGNLRKLGHMSNGEGVYERVGGNLHAG